MPGSKRREWKGGSYKWNSHGGIEEPEAIKIGGVAPMKIQTMMAYPTEVSGWGICDGDPLHVTDILIPKQECSAGSTLMDDEDIASEVTRLAKDENIEPSMSQRIWIHTHPGSGPPYPSGKDWETFGNLLECDWGVMLIFSEDGTYFCRYGFNVGDKKMMIPLPIVISLSKWHDPECLEEIKRKVNEEEWTPPKFLNRGNHYRNGDMLDTGYSRRLGYVQRGRVLSDAELEEEWWGDY